MAALFSPSHTRSQYRLDSRLLLPAKLRAAPVATSSSYSNTRSRGSRRGGGRSTTQRLAPVAVLPSTSGDASTQPPPDLPSYLFKERIVYLGTSLVPSVTELILAEFLYLQYEDPKKPIYLYINSTGTTKSGEKFGYESETFAIYDTIKYIKPPVYTLCVGNAWGEAALLLACGEKGHRAALPSSTIMLKQPINQFLNLQASDIEIKRKSLRKIKDEMCSILATNTGQSREKVDRDTQRSLYLTPEEAVEYGVIDTVLEEDESKILARAVSRF